MEKSNNPYMLEVKVTGFAHVLHSTSHASYRLLLFQSGNKRSHTWCLRLTSPLTKNKQEHPKETANPISFLVAVQQSGSDVSYVWPTRPLQPRGPRHEEGGAYENRLEAGAEVRQISLHMTEQPRCSCWLAATILINVAEFCS